MAYPDSDSSGKRATATPSSWHARTSARTRSALVAGSPRATGRVHVATRANPWRVHVPEVHALSLWPAREVRV